MKSVKQLLVAFSVIAVICFFVSCVSVNLDYPQPQFDKPFVYVIDAFETDGRYEDYIKLHNGSADSNIKFNVYVHDSNRQEWLFYGVGLLKDFNDTDTIDSDIDTIEDYRYFTIESLNRKNYNYHIYTRNNDLHITISDYPDWEGGE
jgi:hypothetical protein